MQTEDDPIEALEKMRDRLIRYSIKKEELLNMAAREYEDVELTLFIYDLSLAAPNMLWDMIDRVYTSELMLQLLKQRQVYEYELEKKNR
jgi:hypothetical protein